MVSQSVNEEKKAFGETSQNSFPKLHPQISEWPRRILMRNEFSFDSSYQITYNHDDSYLVSPFIEVKVECPFGTAIVKDNLPVYGGIIEKDFEITNSLEPEDY